MDQNTQRDAWQQPTYGDDNYNGWKNYETWCIALWLDNDQGSQEWAQELVASFDNPYRAGDALKEGFDENKPEELQSGVFADLLTHALGRVEWADVARHFHEENAE